MPVSLVGAQSPIEKSWSQIISVNHDPQKPISAVVLSVFGSAELPSFSSFNFYPFEAVERLEEESVKLLVYEDFWRNLTAHPLALFEPFAKILATLYRFQLPGPSAVNFRSQEGSVSIRLIDLVFLFLLLCCLGLCYPFAGSSGNQAGSSGVPAGRSPFP
ncbi:hypothetical protein F511_07932 [Dorcoceras hygrometricum]|uniref:Uncharacterized protein n=1 Tax=Dorcoceras hygrometricum TaxID=472368 RepID=A0A2Z7D2Z4_9LAMI|nr:hypothetical protein F511_07932 [Dorcoceras hygrometricum]